ncbi:thiamine phosphate synthase [Aeoliella sp.]|uniref:thiamine phosphate synthase n=1 Tax=Aeoliella sp. TaxID=2795800 RepID=UPI003CCB8307
MNHTNTSTLRILDAALNRAGEGLRVVEDYLRMVLDDGHLAGRAKSLRHDLSTAAAGLEATDRLAARDTLGDVGTQNTTPSENSRGTAHDVAAASFRRVAEALRTIEEYAKLLDTPLAGQCESLRYQLYTLEKAAGLTADAQERLADGKLYVLVDGRESEAAFGELVESLVTAGVGAIQLRDKSLDDSTLLARAEQLVAATRGSTTLAIVNDRADIAMAARADGVHLGQEDMSVAAARKVVGTHMLIGISTHNIQQARQAVLDGANYLGAGPTFASTTKQFTEFAGLDFLREVASEISLPTFAIGGITTENLPQVLASGISRVAVAGAVTGAKSPAEAAKLLQEVLAHSTPAKAASGV